MVKEFNDHTEGNHWKIIPNKEVPTVTRILYAIFKMKRKRDVLYGRVITWISIMTIQGGKQEHGVKYTETYAPVTSWYTIQTLLVLALLNKWHTRQIYFLLA